MPIHPIHKLYLITSKNIKNMSVVLDTYNLRKRHVSVISTSEAGGEPSTNPTIVEETTSLVEEIHDNNLRQNPDVQLEVKKKDKEYPVIDMGDFSEGDMDLKLNLLMIAINKINTGFHLKFEKLDRQLNSTTDGLITRVKKCEEGIASIKEVLNDEEEGALPRLRDVEEITNDHETRLEALEKTNGQLLEEIAMLRGVVQVHDQQLISTKSRLTSLLARSMFNNITISGLVGDDSKENCKEKVLNFLREKMKMEDLKDKEVEVAHRLGPKQPGKIRLMVVRCKFSLRDRVFTYVKNLKDVKNRMVTITLLENNNQNLFSWNPKKTEKTSPIRG